MASHVRKGDQVMVVAGNQRHQKNNVGKVLRVLRGDRRSEDRVIVEGMNICKRHVRPSEQNRQGGVIEKEMPIHISNVVPVVDGKPTRVRFDTQENGVKIRVAVRGGKQLGGQLNKSRQ